MSLAFELQYQKMNYVWDHVWDQVADRVRDRARGQEWSPTLGQVWANVQNQLMEDIA